ncbi:ATP-binding protein [Streptomyces sp. JNUCC 64]
MDPTNREPERHGQDGSGDRTARGAGPDRRVPATSGPDGPRHPDPSHGPSDSPHDDAPYDSPPGGAPRGVQAAASVDGPPRPSAPPARPAPPALRKPAAPPVPVAPRAPEPIPGPVAASRPRPPRDPLTPDPGAPHTARGPVRLIAGDLLLTINPVDGSEIETCPPGELPGPPVRYGAEARQEARRSATAPVPSGPAPDRPVLLEREDEHDRLVELLSQGRSVRLGGAAGSGRTALLDAVAEACADLAPDGVVRLTGYRRTATDLLYELYAAVFDGTGHRPDRAALLDRVRDIGAVVVIDDLAFGGGPLDELLDATPECAFLCAVAPGTPAPSADAPVDELTLAGLSRAASTELLARATGRALTEAETNWAGDLWFESEGLPLRFVQAGALLRHRDAAVAADVADAVDTDDEATAAATGTPGDPDRADDAPGDPAPPPLPSLAEGAAPAALLAAGLSEAARAALRFAVVLDGEVPHQAHLPALIGDTHADAALTELVTAALVTPVGARHRLAPGVRAQLVAAGYPDDGTDAPDDTTGRHALVVARHYAWWAGHPSVAPRRVAAEGDAVLAALAALTAAGAGDGRAEPLDPAADDGPSAPVGLARAAAPVLAAGGDWSAWEAVLRLGVEAARHTGEIGEEAYFHHELGVLALCAGQFGRARAELEASVAMRAAVADRRGAVAGRRALALLTDRSGGPAGPLAGSATAPEDPTVLVARYGPRPVPPAATRAVPLVPGAPGTPKAPGTGGVSARLRGLRRTVLQGARRNLAATGAGALLAAVLGTVVTLGVISDDTGSPAERVSPDPTVSRSVDDAPDDDTPEAAEDPVAPATTQDTRNVAEEVDQRTGSTARPVRPAPTPSTVPSAPSLPTSPAPGTSGASSPGGRPTEPTGRPSSPTTRPGTPTTPASPPVSTPSSPGPTAPTSSAPTRPTRPPITPPTRTPTRPSTSDGSIAPSGGAPVAVPDEATPPTP